MWQGMSDFVFKRFDALRARIDEPSLALGRITPDFAEWEERWFAIGLDKGLFGVRDDNVCHGRPTAVYDGTPYIKADGSLRDTHFIGSTGPSSRALSRETVTQAAAVARLVFEFGHPSEVVRAESPKYEVDIVSYADTSLAARALVAGEAKVRPVETQAFIDGLRACGGRQPTPDAHADAYTAVTGRVLNAGQRKNHHHKCMWIANERPLIFWVVSPAASMVFGVSQAGSGFELTELDAAWLHRDRVLDRARSLAVPNR
jgi:hypothetical protein